MRITKLFIYFMFFFLIGELIIRFDIKYNLSYSKNLNLNNKTIEKALDHKNFNNSLDHNSFENRIMIIGNSFIKGISIQPNNRFANVLLDTLRQLNLKKKPIVLNLSGAGNGIIDNYLSFNEYFTKFNPTTILWFHSLTDINFDKRKIIWLERSLKQYKTPSKKRKIGENNFKNIEKLILSKKEEQKKNEISIFNYISKTIEKSKLIFYLKNNLFNEFLILGIKMPFGKFFYLTNNAYHDNNNDFKLYKKLIKEVIDKANQKKINFIFYNMPEFNLLENPKLFEASNNNLEKAFLDKNINYINGISYFHQYKSSKLTEVRTDSHPNEIAHRILVKQISEILKNIDPNFFEDNNH